MWSSFRSEHYDYYCCYQIIINVIITNITERSGVSETLQTRTWKNAEFELSARIATVLYFFRGFSQSLQCIIHHSGFGGLGVVCWPLVPKFAGSNAAEAVGFLGRKNSQHAFLRRGSSTFRC